MMKTKADTASISTNMQALGVATSSATPSRATSGFTNLVSQRQNSLQLNDDTGRDKSKRNYGGSLSWSYNLFGHLVHEYLRCAPATRILLVVTAVAGLAGLIAVVYLGNPEPFIFYTFSALCLSLAFLFISFWLLSWILTCDEGDKHAGEIAQAIQEGSEGFYATQNTYIFRITIVIAAALFFSYYKRDPQSLPPELREAISSFQFAALAAGTFIFGALCSGLAGYSGVWVSVRANSRVAAAAHRTYEEALQICFRGGAFSSIVNVALAVGGLSLLMLTCHLLFPKVPLLKLPMLLVGFGFGASLVAMFAQLGGGIYTKAADVGADLVGKVEAGIPEDDYRNPAVIADLVGDNVGDCAGQCADLFESMAAEMLAAMILGSALASEAGLSHQVAAGFVLFPLAVHSMDLAISTVAVLCVGRGANANRSRYLLPGGSPAARDGGNTRNKNPLREMVMVYFCTCLVGATCFTGLCWLLLNPPSAPDAWKRFAACGMSGIACALIFLFATQYYTDYTFSKVRRIALASLSGPATNIIAGLSVGMESVAIPIITIGAAIVFSYHQGRDSNIAPEHPNLAGLFGTAVATMGMLCTAVFVLSMSSFGPIADNAGGIVEMTMGNAAAGQQDYRVRDITDRLDAVGNVTKANTKGFSVGTAALASFLLFSAFLDEVSIFVKQPFTVVDITKPDVFVGGLLGSAVILVFSSMALNAVGTTAGQVVEEVRRQFRERPNIMAFTELPDYRKCVKIVSQAALVQMILPGLLACLSPIAVGVIFRTIGMRHNSPMLGVEALGAFMMFSTATGILMALFLNNAGGAWDNAKKYIETGMLGGKGSAAHQAAVVGDTVGDPSKDTAGPSVHVLIKLIATVTLVMTPLFVNY